MMLEARTSVRFLLTKNYLVPILQPRKISAHEFERGGLLKPLVTTVDGTPTFLGDQPPHATPSRPQRRSRHELRQLDEKELIFELVKDICNELEVRVLCHKILQNVSILLDADRGSLFLVQGERASPNPQNGRLVLKQLSVIVKEILKLNQNK
uniref:SFRICE_025087 n=1 Tax=Spodoptera frugiperda TaxID=7108 RepID=A0A2H1VP40_SPOFR